VPERAGLARRQTQTVHDAPRVVRIVAHAEARENGVGEARGGPTVGIEARGARPRFMDCGNLSKLIRVQPAGTPRRPALAESFDAIPVKGAAPARSRSAAHAELARHLGLGKAAFEVSGRLQPPLFQFIASQHTECDRFHASRADCLARAASEYQKNKKSANCFSIQVESKYGGRQIHPEFRYCFKSSI
jgi:hypothetical protein